LNRKCLAFSVDSPKTETLRGVNPEPKNEILRFAQDDRQRTRMTGEVAGVTVWDLLRTHQELRT